jgi:hypothetical protein
MQPWTLWSPIHALDQSLGIHPRECVQSRKTSTCEIRTYIHFVDWEHVIQVDPLAERPSEMALLEEYQRLVAAEKESIQARGPSVTPAP